MSSASPWSQICLARMSSSSLRSSVTVCLITVLALLRRAERSAFGINGSRVSGASSLWDFGVSNRTLPFNFDFGVPGADCCSKPLTEDLGFCPLPGGLPRRRFEGVSRTSSAGVAASTAFSLTWSDFPDSVVLCLGEFPFSFSPSSSCRFLLNVIYLATSILNQWSIFN